MKLSVANDRRARKCGAQRLSRWAVLMGILWALSCTSCSVDLDQLCEKGSCTDTSSPSSSSSSPSSSSSSSSSPPGLPSPYGTLACDLHGFAGSPKGICIPHFDAGWHTALVRKVPIDQPAHCPQSAEWPGFLGEEVVGPGEEVHRIIGCSVNPLATCHDYSFACVPYELDYPPCILQSGQDSCPSGSSYPVKTQAIPEEGGALTTICCRSASDPK